MSEQERKLKEKQEALAQAGVEIKDAPDLSSLMADPMRLKLQELSQRAIGLVQAAFLNRMIKKSEVAYKLGLENSKKSGMSDEERSAFLDTLQANVDFLKEKLADFKENYGRLKKESNNVLLIPSANFEKIKQNGSHARKISKNIISGASAFSSMTSAYEEARKHYQQSPKPIEGRKSGEYALSEADTASIKQEVNKIFSAASKKIPTGNITEEKVSDTVSQVASDASKQSKYHDEELDQRLEEILNKKPIKSKPKEASTIFETPVIDGSDIFKDQEPIGVKYNWVKEQAVTPAVNDDKSSSSLHDLTALQAQLEEAQREAAESESAKEKMQRDLVVTQKDREEVTDELKKAEFERDEKKVESEKARELSEKLEQERKAAEEQAILLQQIAEYRNKKASNEEAMQAMAQQIKDERTLINQTEQQITQVRGETDYFKKEIVEEKQKIAKSKVELKGIRDQLQNYSATMNHASKGGFMFASDEPIVDAPSRRR